jgi:hypothetical protein
MSNVSGRLLDLWSARFIVLWNTDRRPVRINGWKLINAVHLPLRLAPAGSDRIESSFTVWENEGAMPRGFIVGRAHVLRPGETERGALDQTGTEDGSLARE